MNELLESKTLYSRNSFSKLTQWTITRSMIAGIYHIITEWGLLGGAISTTTNIISGKGGRTDAEQSVLEYNSTIRNMMKKGYVEIDDSKDIDSQVPLIKGDLDGDYKPMLAKIFVEGKSNYPRYIQRKIRGVRCEVRFVREEYGLFGEVIIPKFKSREGLVYRLPNFEKSFTIMLNSNPAIQSIVFDGELYIHNSNQGEIDSAITYTNPKHKDLEYRIFDIINDNTQDVRFADLLNIFKNTEIPNNIKLVNWDIVYNDEEAIKLAEQYIQENYEGAITRDMIATYQYGLRNNTMQKIKKVHSAEFTLIDIVAADNHTYKGEAMAIFICKAHGNNKTFRVTPKASHAERAEYYRNRAKYIGYPITVFYRELSKDKIPNHANGVIRDYE
ncbi:ATP dependent DNA ligase domain protein [anaerobic digester metagenome]